MFSFSGFGTIGLASTNRDGAEYVIPGTVRGANKSVSGEVDSKLGLQGTAKFNSQFSATAQILTKQTGKGDWTPQIEWAFGRWQATPALAVRAGRFSPPFFAVSDFRDVGYANTWLRPPIDVYGQVPSAHFDGADLNWTTHIADTNVTVQIYGGRVSGYSRQNKVEAEKQAGVNFTVELTDGLAMRLGHTQGKLTVRNDAANALVGLLRQTPFATVGDEIDITDKSASFSGIGLTYDKDRLILAAEYTMRKTDSIIPDTTGWYTTIGYRVGEFTPYATLSQQKTDSSNVNNTIPASAVVAGVPLRAVVDATIAAQSTPQKTMAIGVRWDAWRNVAIKVQYDSIKTKGAGQFSRAQPSFNNQRVGIYSAVVDFVF